MLKELTLGLAMLVAAWAVGGRHECHASDDLTFLDSSVLQEDNELTWRYKWHEGRWWYWMPSETWKVWIDGRWVNYDSQEYTDLTAGYSSSGKSNYGSGYSNYGSGSSYGGGYTYPNSGSYSSGSGYGGGYGGGGYGGGGYSGGGYGGGGYGGGMTIVNPGHGSEGIQMTPDGRVLDRYGRQVGGSSGFGGRQSFGFGRNQGFGGQSGGFNFNFNRRGGR